MRRRNSFLHFPQKILLFRKKLGKMKIFRMQLVMKQAIIIFGLSKNATPLRHFHIVVLPFQPLNTALQYQA